MGPRAGWRPASLQQAGHGASQPPLGRRQNRREEDPVEGDRQGVKDRLSFDVSFVYGDLLPHSYLEVLLTVSIYRSGRYTDGGFW